MWIRIALRRKYHQIKANFMQISKIIFPKMKKIATHLLSLDVWCLVKQRCAQECSKIPSFSLWNRTHAWKDAMFLYSFVKSLSEGTVPKVLWDKGTSPRRKDLKTDPVSCPWSRRHFEKNYDVMIFSELVMSRTVIGFSDSGRSCVQNILFRFPIMLVNITDWRMSTSK